MTKLALHLVVADPDVAAPWYERALGARETSRVTLPGDITLTIELQIGDLTLAMAAEMPDAGMRTPKNLGASPAAFHLSVPDAETAWRQALEAGAEVFEPLHDAFWGDRTGQFLDPDGHRWALDQHLRDVPPEEIGRLAAELFGAAK